MKNRCQVRPLFADIDAMNVVYYGNYLRYFELGRTELLRSTGRAYTEMANQGLHMPATEAHVRYRRPALYDDLLTVETTIAWLKKASLRFDYRILRAAAGGGEELLIEGYTVHACVTSQGKVAPLPDWLVDLIKNQG